MLQFMYSSFRVNGTKKPSSMVYMGPHRKDILMFVPSTLETYVSLEDRDSWL